MENTKIRLPGCSLLFYYTERRNNDQRIYFPQPSTMAFAAAAGLPNSPDKPGFATGANRRSTAKGQLSAGFKRTASQLPKITDN
jgi:hypothetical protein